MMSASAEDAVTAGSADQDVRDQKPDKVPTVSLIDIPLAQAVVHDITGDTPTSFG